MRIVILGGGPCGLGAAWRLEEMGHTDWLLCERSERWGGLATSIKDEHGFWWDIGGHVLFSHYPYFDQVIQSLFEGTDNGWLEHDREAWVWMQNRFIPYPLQNNIHRLPKEVLWECLTGIMELEAESERSTPKNFGEWIDATFGKGLAKWFMRPYNEKVWGCLPEEMECSWVGDRVNPVELSSVLHNVIFDSDVKNWGPNSKFRFPKFGGTGAIWNTVAGKLPAEKLQRGREAIGIDTESKRVNFSDGSQEEYDVLLSTMPLTHLVDLTSMDPPFHEKPALHHSATHVVGLALNGQPPAEVADKCWIYFPESDCPFYRVTVFSNYSPHNVPDIDRHWSLMCEVSETESKPVNLDELEEEVLQGALNTGLIRSRSELHHTWSIRIGRGYPTPTTQRNEVLFPLLKHLEEKKVYSRGRFGAWRYEVGNMDHSFMQGVEFVEALLDQGEERTLWQPDLVNAPPPSSDKK